MNREKVGWSKRRNTVDLGKGRTLAMLSIEALLAIFTRKGRRVV